MNLQTSPGVFVLVVVILVLVLLALLGIHVDVS